MLERDTIVGPATSTAEGGVGIIRLSGPRSEEFLRLSFRPSRPLATMETRRLYFGHLLDRRGEVVDEVLAVLMRGPLSYTREDVAEVHCHGGLLPLRRALDIFIELGARLARPGEFTLRAFLNGRIDLAQAEAVIDLIRSRSESGSRVALGQLDGKISRSIHRFRDALLEVLSLVEAYIDFPEEEIEPPHLQALQDGVKGVLREVDGLLLTFDSGRVLREGLSILILGRPNVGKSSLLNALLGEARAIVTEVAGTTRDTIEESLVLGGIPLRLIDTAGIRQTDDPVEAEGVRRARDKVGHADLVLLVLDGSQELGEEDLLALEACRNGRVLVVANKADLGPWTPPPPLAPLTAIPVSSHTGEGLDRLRDRIVGMFLPEAGGEAREGALLSDRRHREALLGCREALDRFLEGVSREDSLDLLALELREALHSLGTITGETTPEDVLDRIFSRFCIGK